MLVYVPVQEYHRDTAFVAKFCKKHSIKCFTKVHEHKSCITFSLNSISNFKNRYYLAILKFEKSFKISSRNSFYGVSLMSYGVGCLIGIDLNEAF